MSMAFRVVQAFWSEVYKTAQAVKVILAPTWDLAKDVEAEVTVEAEYGANVKEGTQRTLAHHSGKYKGGPAVSTMRPSPLSSGTILVSHLDLDTIIACLDLLGKDNQVSDKLREISGFVDVNGPHRLDELNLSEEDVDKIHAWWAREEKMERKPRDKVTDVTSDILQAGEVLSKIEAKDAEVIGKGRELKQTGEKLEADSYVKTVGDVVVRKADQFVNHLYKHDKKIYKGVAALNTKFGSVTVSLERSTAGVSCREVVQALWGPEAGGHDGIAGSPRGKTMTEKDLMDAAEAMDKAIMGKEIEKRTLKTPEPGPQRCRMSDPELDLIAQNLLKKGLPIDLDDIENGRFSQEEEEVVRPYDLEDWFHGDFKVLRKKLETLMAMKKTAKTPKCTMARFRLTRVAEVTMALDKVADELQGSGFEKQAAMIDAVSDLLESGISKRGEEAPASKEKGDFQQQVERANTMDAVDPTVAKLIVESGLQDGSHQDDKVSVSKGTWKATDLSPSQTTMVLDKAVGMALSMLKNNDAGGDLGALVSKEGNILDGHHRWAATILAVGPKGTVGGYQANKKGETLLKILNIISKGAFNVRNGQPGSGSISEFTPDNVKKAVKEASEKGVGGKFPISAEEVKKTLTDKFGSVEKGAEQMGRNVTFMKRTVPSWAPDRKQMPVIEPSKVPATAELLNSGKVNWRAPFSASKKTPVPNPGQSGVYPHAGTPQERTQESKKRLKEIEDRIKDLRINKKARSTWEEEEAYRRWERNRELSYNPSSDTYGDKTPPPYTPPNTAKGFYDPTPWQSMDSGRMASVVRAAAMAMRGY